MRAGRLLGSTSNGNPVRPLAEFHRSARYARRFASRRHGLGFTRGEPRPLRTTNQRRNTSCPRSLQERAAFSAKSTMRKEPRPKRSGPSNRSTERAATLWTARRNHIAARRRSACRSRFARLRCCAVASLQARQPCGPLRSVTLARCASGGSGLRATVEVWVRRLRPQNWRR